MGTAAPLVAPLRVLIVDDHPLLLAGLRRALERGGDVEVVGEARSVIEMRGLIERRRPDLVLLDLRMPDVSGTEHIEEVCADWPEVKVVVLSATEDPSAVDAALGAGASAFLVKNIPTADLAALLRQVALGAVIRMAPPRAVPSPAAEGTDGFDLTGRELGVLRSAARGMTTAAISHELHLSEHTIKFHLTNIYRKLGVSNRAAAVRFAIEHGLDA